ncbi:hypothetical protein BMS3Abin06_01775 [bacterium BMS3Abin06]|nr:hypothetical protein BMS3Abin06_01775 [bacterium BMS3Abin06]HDZ01932.1 hypothetical protein [Nitrospirota bacterium]
MPRTLLAKSISYSLPIGQENFFEFVSGKHGYPCSVLSNVKIIEKLSFLTYEEKTAAKDRHIKNQSERASIFLAASFLTDLLRASKSFSASRRNYLKLVKEPVSHVKT